MLTDKQKYNRAWYAENKSRIRKKLNKQNQARRISLRNKIDEFKMSVGCNRCPMKRPACLDFHHIKPSDKKFSIGNAIQMNLCWKTVLKEIKKCVLLCANCHRLEEHTLRTKN